MADVLQFRGNKKPTEFSDSMVDLANEVKGHVAGGLCIVVTADNNVHVICGPDLDGAMSTLAKLQAIMGSMYTTGLAFR